jgi:hypothetical protein
MLGTYEGQRAFFRSQTSDEANGVEKKAVGLITSATSMNSQLNDESL